MRDELLKYLKSKLKDRFVTSLSEKDLLIWAAQNNSTGLNIIALTLTIGVKTSNPAKLSVSDLISRDETVKMFISGFNLSKMAGVDFWLLMYPSVISKDSNLRILKADKNNISNFSSDVTGSCHNFASVIQSSFGTQFQTHGTRKAVNIRTADAFHRLARESLPEEYVRIDIDGLVVDEKNIPKRMIEVKRSFIEVHKWKPWKDDLRNYQLELSLARQANIDFWTLYHKKNIHVDDNTLVGVFKIKRISPEKLEWILYDFNIYKAYKIAKVLMQS
jgi:hypothetical protein